MHTSERQWPERPARAGNNPVSWPGMTVEFHGDGEPAQAQERDRWRNSQGLFELRDGEWVSL